MFLVIICGFSPRKGGYLGWSGGLLESLTPEQWDYERRQESEGLINTNMREPLGQPNVPTARRGRKTIKIGGNLFVSLEEEEEEKKGISQNLSFPMQESYFPLQLLGKGIRLISLCYTRRYLATQRCRKQSAFKAASSLHLIE